MGRDQRISANRAPGPDDPEEPAPVPGVAPRTDASLGPGSGPPIVPPGLARPVEFDDPTGIISDRASDRPTSLIPPRTSRRPRSPSSDPPLLRSLGPPRPAPALTDNPSVQAAIAADLDDSLRAMVEERSQSRPFSLPAAPVTVDNLFDEGTAASGEFHAPPPSPRSGRPSAPTRGLGYAPDERRACGLPRRRPLPRRGRPGAAAVSAGVHPRGRGDTGQARAAPPRPAVVDRRGGRRAVCCGPPVASARSLQGPRDYAASARRITLVTRAAPATAPRRGSPR